MAVATCRSIQRGQGNGAVTTGSGRGCHRRGGLPDRTALQAATIKSLERRKQILLDIGADVNIQGIYGTTLQLALFRGDVPIIQLLITFCFVHPNVETLATIHVDHIPPSRDIRVRSHFHLTITCLKRDGWICFSCFILILLILQRCMTEDIENILTRIFNTLHNSRPIYQSTECPGNMNKSWKPHYPIY